MSKLRFRRLLLWSIELFAVAALVVAVVRYRRAHREPLHYETATVDRGPIVAKVDAVGRIAAISTVQVGAQVSGRIATIEVDFESPVAKGQTLATLESSQIRTAVEQARANAELAQANVESARAHERDARQQEIRARGLLAQNAIADDDYQATVTALDVARADVRSAEAAVQKARADTTQAENDLRNTTITSPIDGVVLSRSVEIGQAVIADPVSATLFTIAPDLDRMEIDAPIPAADLGRVRAGMAVTFTVDAHPNRTFQGTVRQLRDAPRIFETLVAYDTVIDVDNSERLLKPGMAAQVSIVEATRDDALRVPNEALRFAPDKATLDAMVRLDRAVPSQKQELAPDERTLWVLRDRRAVQIVVKTGISDGAHTEIASGDLHPGDRVMTGARVTGARQGTQA